MELSKRLQGIAAKVTQGNRVADIGTDHGYIPIYLVKEGIVPSVIAMDINKDPLQKCKNNIEAHRLSGQISTRLSDGLEQLEPGEVDTVIIAGMGGPLVCNILEAGKEVVSQLEEMILSPHTELPLVRQYLIEKAIPFEETVMVEDRHLYHILYCRPRVDETLDNRLAECYNRYMDCHEEELRLAIQYGMDLIHHKNILYKAFLEGLLQKKMNLVIHLKEKGATHRQKELEAEIKDIRQVLGWME